MSIKIGLIVFLKQFNIIRQLQCNADFMGKVTNRVQFDLIHKRFYFNKSTHFVAGALSKLSRKKTLAMNASGSAMQFATLLPLRLLPWSQQDLQLFHSSPVHKSYLQLFNLILSELEKCHLLQSSAEDWYHVLVKVSTIAVSCISAGSGIMVVEMLIQNSLIKK